MTGKLTTQNRLKITLDLPPIQARPPIPPRIYNKLYTYFDNAVPDTRGSAGQGRTRTRTRAAAGVTEEKRPLPSRPEPTKEQSLAPYRARAASSAQQAGSRLNAWVRPVISFLCAQGKRTALASTMVAGIDYVVAQAQADKAQEPWVSSHMTALMGAVYYFSVLRMDTVKAGSAEPTEDLSPDRKEIVALLKKAREEVEVRGGTDADGWAGWVEVKTAKALNNAIDKVEVERWLDADWYKGIDDIFGAEAGAWDAQDAELATPIQARRADTMHQDRFDYLSEAKSVEYEKWKKEMLSRIAAAKKNAPVQMEVDG